METLTIDELLLGSRNDTTEVGTVFSAVLLCILPGVPVGEVPEGQQGEKILNIIININGMNKQMNIYCNSCYDSAATCSYL